MRAGQNGAPAQDQVRATALLGLAGTTAVPASSALILRARAFRAWLEPLIPSLRRARLDTSFSPLAERLTLATLVTPSHAGLPKGHSSAAGHASAPAHSESLPRSPTCARRRSEL